MKNNITEKIKSVLSSRKPGVIDNRSEQLIHSAVLIPIFEGNNGHEVLFTERTHTVEHHKGQISFPGGSVERKDRNFEETALRETYEEVGVVTEDVEVLGQLDDELTIASNFIVHPFVGTIPYPYDFKINKNEVERIITVPLELFFEENSDRHPDSIEFENFTYRGPAYIYDDVTIWGATAKIMKHFINIVNGNKYLPGEIE
jgi:8-oxo-dGTP pyrophosphatase MutT (NUDIX family)